MSDFYCTNRECSDRGRLKTLEFRNCGNAMCCRPGSSGHYPLCPACGSAMKEDVRCPQIVWTGPMGKRYRDPKREGYYGDSAGEDGFWAYTRNTPDKKPMPVRIENWQQAREFAKSNGCADPREMPTNAEISEDGKKLQTAGMPGQEV